MSQPRQTRFCGHFERAEESELRQLFSKVAAVRAEDPDLFDYTHRPMEVFPSEEASRHSDRRVSEEDILNSFSTERVGNHAVVIEGEVGTGKSELCAYLVHRLRKAGRPILRIDKDDDLMSILTERLPEFYEAEFDESLPRQADFQRLEDDIKETPTTIANFATTAALLNFKQQGYEVAYTDDDESENIDIVRDQLQQLVTKGEYAKRTELISEQAYDRNDCLRVFAGNVPVEEAVEKWNDELWNEIRGRYETPPLSEMLKTVGAKFQDTRPVAVFEDFSIASIEAKQLRNYIERDVPEDNWDFVIAGTRDVTDVLHTQTGEDRFEFYQTNVPNSNSVLFLDEDTAAEFIRPYLAYLKHGDGSLSLEGSPMGDERTELPAPERGSVCHSCSISDDCPRDLFPFNEVFLERIYAGLEESQQSPREYVMKVFDVLKEYYLGGVDAPSSSQHLGADVTNPETPADQIYDDAETFADLAKWYGTKVDGQYVVNRAFATAFGLVEASRPPGELDAGIELTETDVRIPSSSDEIVGQETTPDGDDEGTETSPTPTLSKVERLFRDHRRDVDDWVDDPTADRFSETNDYIATAVESLINHLTDDYTLWSDGELGYSLSSQKRPFVWRAGPTTPSQDQIRIDTTEFERSDARRLLKHGIRLEETSGSADRDEMLRTFGTQFTDYAIRWRQRIIKEYVDSNQVLFGKKARRQYDFDDFVLSAYAWLSMLDDPWRPVTAEALNERFTADADLGIDDNLDAELEYLLPLDDYDSMTQFANYADNLEQLMTTRFAVTSNALDLRAIRRRLSRYEPYDVVDGLAKTYIDDINSRVRFSSSNTLPGMASALYMTRSVLEELNERQGERLLSICNHVGRQLRDIDMERITEVEDGIATYSDVDPQFREVLSRFADHDQKTVDEVVDACEFAATDLVGSLIGNSEQDEIHATLVSAKVFGSSVVEVLHNLEDEWPDLSGEVGGTRFTEVAEYYVE